MKKKNIIKILVAIVLLISFALLMNGLIHKQESKHTEKPSTSEEEIDWKFSENIARKVTDDGWVYSFNWQYLKDGTEDDSAIPFLFNGVNLRYTDAEGSLQILGRNGSEKLKKDMETIAQILDYENGKVTKEELLQLNPDDYTFEEFDKNIFFDLMKEALTGEAHKEDNLVLPTYAMLLEPTYMDNYKFQIGFVSNMGCVDVIFIDVLYKTEDGYVQLSDLAEEDTANEEQKELYELLLNISEGIVAENDLLYDFDKNAEKIIEKVDFSRLYQFLEDIENYDIAQYTTIMK